MTIMFLSHIKADDVTSPKLPFPYPTLICFGSADYNDTDDISFLPAASHTKRCRSTKGNSSFSKHMIHVLIIIFSVRPVPKVKMQM